MFSLLYTFCLHFYLINIHIFDYPDSWLSGLFTEVLTSPDNRGSTVLNLINPIGSAIHGCWFIIAAINLQEELNQITWPQLLKEWITLSSGYNKSLSLLYTFCLHFYLINIHIFDYPDSWLSGLFTEVPTSPDNRGSTVLNLINPIGSAIHGCWFIIAAINLQEELNQITWPQLLKEWITLSSGYNKSLSSR